MHNTEKAERALFCAAPHLLVTALLLLLSACGSSVGNSNNARADAKGYPQMVALSHKGRVIQVPAEEPTIAAGMAAAQAGDTVKLAPGSYKETLKLKTGVSVIGGPSTIDATALANGIIADESVTCCASVEALTVLNSVNVGILINEAKGVNITNSAVRGSCVTNLCAGIQISGGAEVTIQGTEISGSGGDGVDVFASKVSMVHNTLHNNVAGMRISHGSIGNLVGNQVSANTRGGVTIDAGDDENAQVRSSVSLQGNTLSGGFIGLNVANSDIESMNNHYDQNQEGVLFAFGAAMRMQGDAILSNTIQGIDARGAVEYLFCGNSDCSLTKLVFSPVHLTLENVQSAGNGASGLAVTGGSVSVSKSSFSGNGASYGTPGIDVESIYPYDLGDGIPRQFNAPASVRVVGSSIESNQSPGALVLGTCTLDIEGTSIANNQDNVDVLSGASAVLQSDVITGGSHGVFVQEGGRASIELNQIRGNQFNGVTVFHGGVAKVEQNEITGNGNAGVSVRAGDNLSDQLRSSAELQKNVLSGNAVGLEIVNSDVRSDGDRVEQNGFGMSLNFGANLNASSGTISANHRQGMSISDVNLFCSNTDCTLLALGVAPSNAIVKQMHIDGNGFAGIWAAPGGHLSVVGSSIRGNAAASGPGDVADGIAMFSGWNYELGDGVPRTLDIGATATVRNSRIEANVGWCADVNGSSTVDLGTFGHGGNSCVANTFGAVGNFTNPPVVVRAEGNWWGTTDPAAIARMMAGASVDFVPFLTMAPAGSVVFSAAGDFSATSNPNGDWSYGFTTTPGGTFNLDIVHGATSSSGEVGWFGPIPGAPFAPGYPLVVAAPGSPTLDMGPGPSSYTVVRWTAPSAGAWDVLGQFFGTGVTTTDVHVFRGPQSLFDGSVDGSTVVPFSLIVNLSAGAALDFIVGPGPGGDNGGDPTGFSALILPHP